MKNAKSIVVVLLVMCLIIGVLLLSYQKWPSWKAVIQMGDPQKHEAYAGELKIKSVDISVSCIEVDASDYSLSELAIDREQCAAKIWYRLTTVNEKEYGTWIVADHNFQGFEAIVGCKVGDEAVFINKDGSEDKYFVVDTFEGYINEHGMLVNGAGEEFLKSEPSNIVLMTCYPDANVSADSEDRRFFVYLERVGE